MPPKNLPNPTPGFTIVELIVASSVFSLVLLVTLTGFVQIGRLFYKGVADAQTQNVVRDIANDISNNLQNTSSDGAVSSELTYGAYRYYCVGSIRYTYGVYPTYPDSSLNNKISISYDSSAPSENMNPSAAEPNMGLIRDKVRGEGSCPKPCLGCTAGGFLALDTNSPQEMLGDSMRISTLKISPLSSGLYDINIVVAYGSNDTIGYSGDTPPVPYCLGNSRQQQFCAIQQLTTTAYRGSRTQL